MINRTEKEIMNTWNDDVDKPLVSICCGTYNQENYITDAIEGFLMQETDFPFEIIIRDDYSTDKTASIVKKYSDKYPNLIKPIFETENQYSKGVNHNIATSKQAVGKYIAICEGDDYWIDKYKLQIQIDILKKHKDIDMCFHKAMKIDMKNQENVEIGIYLNEDGIVPIEDILLKSKGQIPTASIVVKKSVLEDLMAFFTLKPSYKVVDIFIHFFGSKRGGAYYMNQTMSVYRHYAPDSWSSMQQNNDYKKKILSSDSRIKAYEELNTFENNNFTLAFNAANKKRALVIIKDTDIPWFAKVSFIFKHRKYFFINEKIAYFGLALIPISSFIPKNTYEYLKKLFKMPSYKEK